MSAPITTCGGVDGIRAAEAIAARHGLVGYSMWAFEQVGGHGFHAWGVGYGTSPDAPEAVIFAAAGFYHPVTSQVLIDAEKVERYPTDEYSPFELTRRACTLAERLWDKMS